VEKPLKVDVEDVLFWMDAIRNSDDRYRTLESFWKGQVHSKLWLIEKMQEYKLQGSIAVYGGWNGVLSNLLFNSDLCISDIESVDLDPTCKTIAETINMRYHMQGRFFATTADMCEYTTDADVAINTSCEHLTQEQYDKWLSNIQPGTKVVLQSNNYFDLDEHIRCASNMEEFDRQSNVYVAYVGEFETPKYTRYMIIGHKFNS
jgi:hypothetical protein